MVHRFIAVVVFCATAAAASAAVAAPQALLLVADGQALPLTCEGGICQAEASAICLQPDRPIPLPGTAYGVPAGRSGHAEPFALLIGETAAGKQIVHSVPPALAIVSEREPMKWAGGQVRGPRIMPMSFPPGSKRDA